MNLGNPLYWEALYDRILTSLGLEREKDYYSCRLLDLFLSTRMDTVLETRRLLSELIGGKRVVVVGDSPGLGCPKPSGTVLIAADASYEKCLEEGAVPDVVATDLDGVSESSLKTENTVLAIHAHGDNAELLVRLLPEVRGPFVGTAQCKCSPRVELPGGFTDGDRAVFLAFYYGAEKVYLYGFDFSSVGRYLKPSGVRVSVSAKLAKLAWARLLLLLLRDSGYGVECLEGGCKGWV